MLPKEHLDKLRDQFAAKIASLEIELVEQKAQLNAVDELEAAVDSQLGDLQKKLDAVPELLIDAEKKGYDQALEDMKLANSEDKIFSNAEFEAELALRLKPIEDKVAALEVAVAEMEEAKALDAEKIASLSASLEAVPGMVDAAKAEAVAAFKGELLAKYEEQQVAESKGETGFAALLK
jgi:uncharacterized coiled-coil protein SlyX